MENESRLHPNDSINNALLAFPKGIPTSDQCYQLGEHFVKTQEWASAIFWFQLAASMPEQAGTDQASRTWLPHLKLCFCYHQTGDTVKAHYHNEMAARYYPDHPSIVYNQQYYRQLYTQQTPGAERKKDIALSVLIPSLPERAEALNRVMHELQQQIGDKPVELLVATENRKRTIGAKRNLLIEQAQGRFITFVDDDDQLKPHYVDTLLRYIEENPAADCFVFDVAVFLEGVYAKLCKYGIEYNYGSDGEYYYRKPNHLMCHARRLAARHRFADSSYGEDDEWAYRIAMDIRQQVRIPETLYEYVWVNKPADWYVKHNQ
ncbi:glycosyltransferase family 2 protein [Paenibacillus mesotrionivorans]|uniref:Glycosyltransferase family 2 protein n=1 Tax=Paenibacillus mesotrionivorans TaxID=3160968 RepID=A0ACC7P5I9_9BACL